MRLNPRAGFRALTPYAMSELNSIPATFFHKISSGSFKCYKPSPAHTLTHTHTHVHGLTG